MYRAPPRIRVNNYAETPFDEMLLSLGDDRSYDRAMVRREKYMRYRVNHREYSEGSLKTNESGG